MFDREDCYLLITKLNDTVDDTSGSAESKILRLFTTHTPERKVKGIKVWGERGLYIINGNEALPGNKKGSFQKFWTKLKDDDFLKPSEDFAGNLIIEWVENLKSNNKLTSQLGAFFKTIAGDCKHINLLIHFGGGGRRPKEYPQYLTEFLNTRIVNGLSFEVVAISSIDKEGALSFAELHPNSGKLKLAYIAHQVRKKVGEKKALFKALEDIYDIEKLPSAVKVLDTHLLSDPEEPSKVEKEASSMDEGGNTEGHKEPEPSIVEKETFSRGLQFHFPEITLNGIPLRKPKFFDVLFPQEGKRKQPVNIIYLNPDSFRSGSFTEGSGFELTTGPTIDRGVAFGHSPTLFLGFFDLKDDEGLIKKWWDARYRFFDSCIWFRYANLKKAVQVQAALSDIKKNLKDGTYKLSAAREFLDFQIRLFENSYIKRLGLNSHHSEQVTPFSFHSETKLKAEADKVLCKIKHYSWNILIIDDYVQSPMGKNGPDKLSVIKKVLHLKEIETDQSEKKYISCHPAGHSNLRLNFYPVSQFAGEEGALKLIEIENGLYFDIILLDFLFENGTQTEFGHEFILKLNSLIKDHKWGKFWIMPISVYQNALTDHLRDQLISMYDDHLIITEGADPICTPQLFRYRFLSFLALQQKELATVYGGDSFDTIIKKGEAMLKDSNATVQEWAFNSFVSIVELGVTFKRLCKYQKISAFSSSALAIHFFKMKDENDWYHIQNLFYLLAFGSHYQYPQAKKELLYIYKTILDENPLFESLNRIINEKLGAR